MTTLAPELAAKRDRLLDLLRSFGSCAVAFSGGVDSAVLTKAAQVALGDRAVAVTGVSASMAAGEADECERLAALIGIRHQVIATGELDNPEYQKNDANRCYHCKTDLFVRVEAVASRVDAAVVADGSNWDDRGDYRPGMKASRDLRVRSPLAECELTKQEIRQLAASWDLPIWDKPATPCLSSRIAYGETVTAERLAMVDRGERFLRGRGFQPCRVRYHKGDIARIEVARDAVDRLLDPELRREILDELKSAGFKYVTIDLEGFRSGSMNAVLPVESLTGIRR
jgi:uncharacterized protein